MQPSSTTHRGEPDIEPPRTRDVVVCPMCGRPGATPRFSAPDRMLGVPGIFHYRRCRACATVFQDPRVVDEDLSRLYPDGYYTRSPGSATDPHTVGSVRGPAGTGFRARLRDGVQAAGATREYGAAPPAWGRLLATNRWLRERAFFDLVPDEMLPWQEPAGRALDVGCGNGGLMVRLAAVGWSCQGLEVDADAAAVARDRTGRPVHVGDVGSLDPAHRGTFDLVTLSHVFEHLPDPSEALAGLARLLSPRGRLVLLYPNPESLGARAFGPHWFAWDAPRHLVLPPVRAAVELGRRVGLRCRSARTLPRWAADHAMQSRAYRRGEGLQAGPPGPLDGIFGALERALMILGADVGEEALLALEYRP